MLYKSSFNSGEKMQKIKVFLLKLLGKVKIIKKKQIKPDSTKNEQPEPTVITLKPSGFIQMIFKVKPITLKRLKANQVMENAGSHSHIFLFNNDGNVYKTIIGFYHSDGKISDDRGKVLNIVEEKAFDIFFAHMQNNIIIDPFSLLSKDS
jgi:hypothetical protein